MNPLNKIPETIPNEKPKQTLEEHFTEKTNEYLDEKYHLKIILEKASTKYNFSEEDLDKLDDAIQSRVYADVMMELHRGGRDAMAVMSNMTYGYDTCLKLAKKYKMSEEDTTLMKINIEGDEYGYTGLKKNNTNPSAAWAGN